MHVPHLGVRFHTIPTLVLEHLLKFSVQANFCTILQTKKYTTNSLDLLRVDGKVSKLQCYIVYVRTKWTQKKKSQCSETEDGKASLLWWGGGYSGGESAERSLVFVLMFFLIALIGFNKIIFWTLRLACVLRDPCRAAGGGWLARTTGISPQMTTTFFYTKRSGNYIPALVDLFLTILFFLHSNRHCLQSIYPAELLYLSYLRYLQHILPI